MAAAMFSFYDDYYKGEKDWTIENVVIPAEIDGKIATKISDEFFYVESEGKGLKTFLKVKSIVIPEGIETIGKSAFSVCYALEKITLPNSLKTIEASAFDTCFSLKTINIPDNITSIPSDLFSTKISLEYIEVGSNNQNYSSIDGVLFNKEGTILISYPIGSKREEYQIPSSVNTIKSGIFTMNSENIEKMIEAFKTEFSIDLEVPNLKKVVIPNSVQTVEANAFGGGTTEHTIKVPYSNEGSRPAGWNEQWNADCSAVIEYTQS